MKATSALEWINKERDPSRVCAVCKEMVDDCEREIKNQIEDPFEFKSERNSSSWNTLKPHARHVQLIYQREGWTVYYRPTFPCSDTCYIKFRFYAGRPKLGERIKLRLCRWRGGR